MTDDWILASVQRAGGHGKHHPSTGWYADLVISGLASRDEAVEYKRSLFRCALYLHRNGIADISISTDKPEHQPDGTWSLRFRAVDKAIARAYILAKHGTDRSRWPYDPRRRNGTA